MKKSTLTAGILAGLLAGCGGGSSTECQEGERRCRADVLEACSGGAFAVQEDCAASGKTCQAPVGAQPACVAPACNEGELRCRGDVLEVCSGGAFVVQEDCAASGKTCQAPVGAQPACVAPACNEGEKRCSQDILEECRGGVYAALEDCSASGGVCGTGPKSGTVRCLGMLWRHRSVTIQDPIVNGTSLMMAIDNPTFGFDPASGLFMTSFDHELNDPTRAFLWQYHPGTGIHQKFALSGTPLPTSTNFCGGENWCQFISFDGANRQFVVLGPSTPSIMRVGASGQASLASTSGTRPPDNWIGHSHVFDWTSRKLYLYGAIGPSSYSSAIYELDLDSGVWARRVSSLTPVEANCLAVDGATRLLYSFGGNTTSDGGETHQTLSTYQVVDLDSGVSQALDLPADFGPREQISCAIDASRGLVFLLGGALVHDNYNEIENDYHNDLWVLRLADSTWTRLLPDGNLGSFTDPDSYGDRRYQADPDLPNFGRNRGLMLRDAGGDTLWVMGEVPMFHHGQPYSLWLEGVEEYLP
jgi:hypothetical protein